jgi:hypothetical protein
MFARLRSVAVALPLLIAACNSSSNPAAAPAPRTVASMLPKLTRSLTPAGAEAAFGAPDERTGSGLIIYVYRAEQGRKVYLGFPGFAAIIYARAVDVSGGVEDLTLSE